MNTSTLNAYNSYQRAASQSLENAAYYRRLASQAASRRAELQEQLRKAYHARDCCDNLRRPYLMLRDKYDAYAHALGTALGETSTVVGAMTSALGDELSDINRAVDAANDLIARLESQIRNLTQQVDQYQANATASNNQARAYQQQASRIAAMA